MDILSTEVVTGLITIGAISMSVRSIIAFSKTVSELRPKLTEVDRRLNRKLDGMENHKSKVTGLNELISPLKQQKSNLQSYYNEIKRLEFTLEREKLVSEQSKGAKKDLEIQCKNLEGI